MIRAAEIKIAATLSGEMTEAELKELEEISQQFIDQLSPGKFDTDEKSDIIDRENNLEAMYSAMEECNIDVRGLTVYEFHARLKYFEDKSKERNNGHK